MDRHGQRRDCDDDAGAGPQGPGRRPAAQPQDAAARPWGRGVALDDRTASATLVASWPAFLVLAAALGFLCAARTRRVCFVPGSGGAKPQGRCADVEMLVSLDGGIPSCASAFGLTCLEPGWLAVDLGQRPEHILVGQT